MWGICNAAGSYYQFEPTRSGRVIEEILKGYQGPIISDGYAGYQRLSKEGITRVAHCWAHVRRKFYDIRDYYPDETKVILNKIGLLFEYEHQASTYEELKVIRQKQSAPLLKDIFTWLFETHQTQLPESALAKAIAYTLKLQIGLSLFVNDTSVPLSNNEAERTLRHAVMGRKNFEGSKTINGADTAATLYTIIDTCKKVQLNVKDYMREVISASLKGNKPLTPLKYAQHIRTQQQNHLSTGF